MRVLGAGFFVLILGFYLLLDGKRLVAWLLAFVPRALRPRVAETVPEVSEVIITYTRTQLILSFLFTSFSLVVLTAFRVPAALPLAILAGLCDVIPVLGIVIASSLATLLGLTVSVATAGCVLAFYALYHMVEVYMLLPRLYGARLRISTLAVLIALGAGATLYGVIGAILALPIVAAYPVIERRWLRDTVGRDTVKDHSALHNAEPEENDAVVESVLKGEPHEARALESTEQ